MYLLIDECCAKCLVTTADSLGLSAQSTSTVRVLGRGASDLDIFRFAVRHHAVIVTENADDFIALGRKAPHAGMIFLPSQRPRPQARSLSEVSKVAVSVFGGRFPNRFLRIDASGAIVSFR